MKISAFENQLASGVTVKSNTSAVKTEIFRFTCPDRMMYTLLSGTPFVIKLYTSADAEIEPTAELFICTVIPSQPDTPIEIQKFAYAPFYNLTVAEQMNVNNQEPLRIDIPRGKVSIKEVQALIIELKANAVVSWGAGHNSTIQFEMIPAPFEIK